MGLRHWTGTVSGNLDTAGNWDTKPTETDTAILNAGCTYYPTSGTCVAASVDATEGDVGGTCIWSGSGTFTSYTISGGTFNMAVSAGGPISGGTFNGTVANAAATISAGTFNGTVTNSTSGVISGGTFNGAVTNTKTISGGTFNGAVSHGTSGVISGGTFNGNVTKPNGTTGTIRDGTFNGKIIWPNGSTVYGHASKITNCTAGNVKDGVTIDDVSGTYSPGGTYAAGQAARLVVDQGIVSASKAYIYPDADILSQNDGTLRASNIGTLAGTDNLAAADLRYGKTVDNIVGTLRLPNAGVGDEAHFGSGDASLVAASAFFGAANAIAGTAVLTEDEVASAVAAIGTNIATLITLVGDVPTTTEFAARTLIAAGYADKSTLDAIDAVAKKLNTLLEPVP